METRDINKYKTTARPEIKLEQQLEKLEGV